MAGEQQGQGDVYSTPQIMGIISEAQHSLQTVDMSPLPPPRKQLPQSAGVHHATVTSSSSSPSSPTATTTAHFEDAGQEPQTSGDAKSAEHQDEEDPTAFDPDNPFVSATTEYLSAYSMPNSKSMADSVSLPMGVLVSPAVAVQPPPPVQNRKPLRCESCRCFLNKYCTIVGSKLEGVRVVGHDDYVPATQWRCVFCGAVNLSAVEQGAYPIDLISYEACPELCKKVVDFVDHSSTIRTRGLHKAYVFVVDSNASQAVLRDLHRSLVQIVANLQPDSLLGLVTFDSTVSVYRVCMDGVAVAHTVSGRGDELVEEDLAYLLEPDRLLGEQLVLGKTQSCADTFLSTIEALAEAARDDSELDRLHKPRCIGVAVNVARILAKGDMVGLPTSPGGHVVLCTTGACNCGPSSVAFLEDVSRKAHEHFTTVHTFCAGLGDFHMQELRALGSATGGSTVLYKTFGMRFAADLWQLLHRACGFRGLFQIRTSAGVSVSRVIGNVTELMSEEKKQDAAEALTFGMAAVHADECLTVYLGLRDDIPDDYVYLQFVLYYNDLQENTVTRVITRRVPTTGSFEAYMHSLDPNVVAVLIARRSVLMATKPEFSVEVVHADLDEQVREVISTKHTDVVLASLPRILYQLRRGPMLGAILQHPDDIYAVRAVFLHCSLPDAMRLLDPHVMSFDSQGAYEELPLETPALLSHRILMLDHQTQIFIWSGARVRGEEYNAYRDAFLKQAHEFAGHRFPSPEILVFDQGSSAARWLECRLSPTHNDGGESMRKSFPQLERLNSQQFDELVKSLPPTQEFSFRAYVLFLTKGRPNG